MRGCFDADVEGKPRVVEVAEVVLGEYIRHEGHGVDPSKWRSELSSVPVGIGARGFLGGTIDDRFAESHSR